MEMTDIKKIGNLGAGTMGHATALQFAMKGYDVTVVDTAQPALDRGRKLVERDLDTFIKAGMVKAEERDAVLGRIAMTTDYEALAGVDFIIESVLENLEVKHDVWKKVEGIVSDQTILATNTSGLSPSAIANGLQHPGRFVVAHFWNPAQLMPLVEVVPGEKTNQATVDITVELMNHIGKHAVPLKTESLGFVGNRIQLAVIRECLNIVERGIATPEAVDDIVKYSLGRRWAILGPIASADLGGLDVFDNISKYLYDDLSNETGEDPALNAKVDAGELGSKSGKGFYDWQGEQAAQTIQSRDDQLLEALSRDKDE